MSTWLISRRSAVQNRGHSQNIPHLKNMSVFSCIFCRESEGDHHLILRNSDVRQVGRLDPEVRHINGAGRLPGDRIAHDLSLHVKNY
jgi:hypothetical protein